MDERFERLFLRQVASGFEDLHGAEASVTLPVSERLLNELVSEAMPRPAPVRELHVRPQAGDRFAVRVRIGSSPLFPAFNISLSIERQPELPGSPVLVLRMETSGLLSLAGPALRFLDALPPGIRVEHDRIYVDLSTLLEARRLSASLAYVEQLQVHTIDGAVVVSIRAAVRRQQPC